MVSPLRRRLGRTDLEVFPLNLGGNAFGWTADREATFAVLDAYREAGGNFLDTADVYSNWVPGHAGGESERLIGAWLSSRGCRDEFVVATKGGMGGPDLGKGLSPDQVKRGGEASLGRLGIERMTAPIASATNASQVRELASSVELRLDARDMATLDA